MPFRTTSRGFLYSNGTQLYPEPTTEFLGWSLNICCFFVFAKVPRSFLKCMEGKKILLWTLKTHMPTGEVNIIKANGCILADSSLHSSNFNSSISARKLLLLSRLKLLLPVGGREV